MSSELLPVESSQKQEKPEAEPAPAHESRLRQLMPLLVLAVGLLGAVLLVLSRPRVQTVPPEILPPLVRTLTATPEAVRLVVRAQGTVVPRTETELVAEVTGRVMWISPAMVAGGFFDQGETLLRLDDREHRVVVEQATATLERRESEAQLAARNLARRNALFEEGILSDAALDDADAAAQVARAGVREARASLERAKLDLQRSAIQAPYDGRVRVASVDVGQYVSPGVPLATVYAVDYAEVRLPIPDGDLAHLGFGVDFGSDGADEAAGASVVLSAGLGGRQVEWPARLVRTEAELDPQTRMVHVVARVDDPYGRAPGAAGRDRSPLPVGLFVEAEIQGRTLDGVIGLPRAALRGADQVLVVDDEDRLRFRRVEVVQRDRERVLIAAGLAPGERVCVSPLEAATEGMRVRVSEPARRAPESS